MKTELVKAQDYGIEAKKEQELLGNLPQIKKERDILEAQYSEVIKMDIENPESWKKARELRMLIQKNRTQGINIWHKTTKDFFLKGGQFVDAIKRKEVEVNERMEVVLLEIEKHEEIERQKEIKRLNDLRISETEVYKEFIPFGINLGEMQEEDYQKLLQGAKMQFEAEQERLRKEEEERIENERLNKIASERRLEIAPYAQFNQGHTELRDMSSEDYEALLKSLIEAKRQYESEQEKVRIENERLKKEAEEKEKALELERKKAKEQAEKLEAKRQAEIKIEREKQDKLEAELQEKKDAEAKAEREKLAEEQRLKKEAEKLKKAPIKEQMTKWIDDLVVPEISVENEVKDDIIKKFESFKNWAKSQINNL